MIPVFALAISTSRAATFTSSAVADALVSSNAPSSNFGGAGGLSISGSLATNANGVANGVFHTFIRFDTAAMVSNFNSLYGSNRWAIADAKLRLKEQGAPANMFFNRGQGSFEIRWIANTNWVEGTGMPNTPATNGIVYNDEPALLNPAFDVTLGTFTNGAADVTLSLSLSLAEAFVNSLKAGGDVGFFLAPLDAFIGFTFYSRTFGTIPSRPYLEISALPLPEIFGISLSGADIVVAATNGLTGQTYHLLSSTNVATPFGQWVSIATNVPSADGNFSVTAPNALSAASEQFFVLQAQ